MKRWVCLLLFLAAIRDVTGQPVSSDDVPFIGAQVFIEPGQTPEQVDGWFRTLSESGMKVCRIRMFESYMRTGETWDFRLFDRAFDAAEKYGVKVYATLFPSTTKTNIGGWKLPRDDAQKASFAEFVDLLVAHYKGHPALKGWVLINEPGGEELPQTPFVAAARTDWQRRHPLPEFTSKGYPYLVDFDDQRFLMDLNTEFLSWISRRIRRMDRIHDIHVNPHAIFGNCAQYDFPRWRNFLTSLGGSAHAAWHFGYFDRDEYALAMLANSEMIRSGSGPLPWLMTELQGGNNTYSGMDALCPTPAEIAQWLWIVLGTEGKGGIFWTLNPRTSGFEAGEWAMLDFQDRPTARLVAARGVAAAVEKHASLLAGMKIQPSGIDVLYFRESLWAEQKLAKAADRYAGRREGAVLKSALSCFRALTECGLHVGLKEASEYDFTQNDYSGRSIILADQLSVPAKYVEALEHFVSHGGTLFIEGLSLYFDEYLQLALHARSTCMNLLGASLSEYCLVKDIFSLKVEDRELPCHLWRGTFVNSEEPMHVHELGRGRVIWLPSNVALGAWQTGNFEPLSDFLLEKLAYDRSSVRFATYHSGLLLRTLASGKDRVLVCVNKSGHEATIRLEGLTGFTEGREIYRFGDASYQDNTLVLSPESVLVIHVVR